MNLRSILLSIAVLFLAMVPLAMEFGSGSESWSPLARAVSRSCRLLTPPEACNCSRG